MCDEGDSCQPPGDVGDSPADETGEFESPIPDESFVRLRFFFRNPSVIIVQSGKRLPPALNLLSVPILDSRGSGVRLCPHLFHELLVLSAPRPRPCKIPLKLCLSTRHDTANESSSVDQCAIPIESRTEKWGLELERAGTCGAVSK